VVFIWCAASYSISLWKRLCFCHWKNDVAFKKCKKDCKTVNPKQFMCGLSLIAKLPHWGWLWYVALIRASCVATQLVVPLVFVIAWEEVWKWLKFLNVFLEDYRLYATKLHNAWLEIWWFVASCSKFRLWRILLKETLPYVSCAVARQLTSK